MSRPSDRLTSENKEELSELIPFEVLLEGWKMMRWHGKINGITVFTEDGFLEMNVRTLDVGHQIEVNRKHETEFDIGVGPNRLACGWNS